MIAGDGGDELFAGNERYVANRIFDNYSRLPQIVRRRVIEPTISLLSQNFESNTFRRCRNFVKYANIAKAEPPFAGNLYGEAVANGVFNPDFLKKVDLAGPLREIRAIIERAETSSDVQRVMHTDLQRTLSDNDLVKIQRMCESAGVDFVGPNYCSLSVSSLDQQSKRGVCGIGKRGCADAKIWSISVSDNERKRFSHS